MSSSCGTTGDQIEFTWKIENFDKGLSLYSDIIRSPLIALGNPRHSALYLELWHFDLPDGRAFQYETKFLNICPVQGFECEVFIIDQGGEKISVPSSGFITVGEKYILQGALTLHCLIKFGVPVEFTTFLTELSHKISNLYDRKEFSDITLHTNDKEFFLHKFLLRKRAPKFFDDLGLWRVRSVKVKNMSTAALQNLLQYLYSGTLNSVSEESLSETYQLFEKYQFEEFANEIINAKSPSTFCTRIKVASKTVHFNIDVSKALNERNVLNTCIHIDFARFLVNIRLTSGDQEIRIHTSIRCLSSQKDEIVMSCMASTGLNVNHLENHEAERMRFSSCWEKEHRMKPVVYCGKTSSGNFLLFNLHFKICNSSHSSSVEGVTFMFPEIPSIIGMHLLKDDLFELFYGLDDKYKDSVTDVTLDCKWGKLNAHKAVLATWSPLFSSMFQRDVLKENDDQVNISDIDVCIVSQLLSFMYTGELRRYFEDYLTLYAVADKFQVTSLLRLCSSSLASRLADDNVCDVLALADQHSDESLFAAVQIYIATRRDVILCSSEWLSLVDANPRLTSKVLREMPFLVTSERV